LFSSAAYSCTQHHAQLVSAANPRSVNSSETCSYAAVTANTNAHDRQDHLTCSAVDSTHAESPGEADQRISSVGSNLRLPLSTGYLEVTGIAPHMRLLGREMKSLRPNFPVSGSKITQQNPDWWSGRTYAFSMALGFECGAPPYVSRPFRLEFCPKVYLWAREIKFVRTF
jgi:hypothetical protein